jgi:hypothetical protein
VSECVCVHMSFSIAICSNLSFLTLAPQFCLARDAPASAIRAASAVLRGCPTVLFCDVTSGSPLVDVLDQFAASASALLHSAVPDSDAEKECSLTSILASIKPALPLVTQIAVLSAVLQSGLASVSVHVFVSGANAA